MFGLTKREQYLAEQRRAAELLAGLAATAVRAAADVSVAEAKASGLTAEDVRRIVREELAAAAQPKE